MSILFDGSLFADYHQIYLIDAASDPTTPERWTNEAVKARILTDKSVLTFTTARNMTVPIRVELHASEPSLNLERVDHAVVGSLLTSGRIVIAGLTDYYPDAARFTVPPGNLRVMIVSTGLGTLSADGLAGEDRYTVHLWPGPAGPVQVLKQWSDR